MYRGFAAHSGWIVPLKTAAGKETAKSSVRKPCMKCAIKQKQDVRS